MNSFWNQERDLYEIRNSFNSPIIAETKDTATMMRMLTHNTEVNALRESYLQREKALREFIAAYPPVEDK